MMSTSAPGRNLFLAGLSGEDFALIRPHLSRKELRAGDNLHFCGDRTDEIVLPQSGLVIMTAPLRDQAGAAIATIGREGVIGSLSAAASAPANCDAEVLITGQALRMSASAFRYALNQSSTFRRNVDQFNYAMMAHAQQTALCNAAHSVEARICRWLLDVQDRSGDDRIPLTQGTWARLLAVRRTTVTLVVGRLEAAGLLDCRRGLTRIVDRAAVEQRCCECYAHLRDQTLLLGEPRERAPAEDRAAAGQPATSLAASRLA